MIMPKKAGIVFVIAGAVLILSALLLFSRNEIEDKQAEIASQNALEDVQEAIFEIQEEEQFAEIILNVEETYVAEETEPAELPTVSIDGYEYVGYLSIPALELELPVLAEVDEVRLKIAPCRQSGSPDTDDFVIAGHNYTSHFAKLYTLNSDDLIKFTDLNGKSHEYTVEKTQTHDPEDADMILNSGYPLVLYTCTYGSENRTVVFCGRGGEE